MENLLTFLLIRALSPNTMTAINTFNKLFEEPKKVAPKRVVKQPKEKVTQKPVVRKVVTEEDELMESLSYFQGKSYQTKEDKEAIRMIKLMLKNRK
jgi:hypothetical protein